MKTEHDLLPAKRSIYLKALSALELRNYSLTASLMQPLVIEEPEFLAGRKLLREAQVLNSRGKSSFLGISTRGLSLGKSKVHTLIAAGKWQEALAVAEKGMGADPLGLHSNRELFEAAEAGAAFERPNLGKLQTEVDSTADEAMRATAVRKLEAARKHVETYEEIARFALETAALDPKNTKARHELGDYFLRIENFTEALKVFEEIMQKAPGDLEVRDKAKEAAARRSMKQSGLQNTTFSDMVKHRQAVGKEEKVVVAEESSEELARLVYEAHEAGTPDRESARKLADLYFNNDDYEKALEYYRYLSALANQTDSGLLRKISDVEIRILSHTITEKEEALAAMESSSPEAATLRGELEELLRERAEHLLGAARRRVERNPTDLQFRYELGEQLVLAKHYKEAIPELQKARNNPNTRLRALNLLGQCYSEHNMLDLAAKTLLDAASEIPGTDGTKKDILYQLGLVYERMGSKEKALDCMKQIYEVDYGYLDVAERVESSYTA